MFRNLKSAVVLGILFAMSLALAGDVFLGDNSNPKKYIQLKAPASVGTNIAFTLPNTDGTANQCLVTNGSKTLSFASPSAGLGTGSITSTMILDGTILDADVNASAAIALTKLGVLTGYSSGAGTISAADTVLGAIQKLNGNDALKANRPTVTSAALGSDFTINSGTYTNATGLVVTVTTPAAGEVAWVSFRAAQVDSGSSGTAYYAYNVNGGADVVVTIQSLAISFGANVSFAFPISLSSGSNAIQLRVKNGSGTQVIQGNSTNGFATLSVTQFG